MPQKNLQKDNLSKSISAYSQYQPPGFILPTSLLWPFVASNIFSTFKSISIEYHQHCDFENVEVEVKMQTGQIIFSGPCFNLYIYLCLDMEIQFFEKSWRLSVPHLHVCNQPRGNTDWTKSHTVLPDIVRVHLRKRKWHKILNIQNVMKQKI